MSTVSGASVRDELMDLLREFEVPSGVERMRDLGLDRAYTRRRSDPELVASASLGAVALGPIGRWPRWQPCAPPIRWSRPLGRRAAARGPRPRRGFPRPRVGRRLATALKGRE